MIRPDNIPYYSELDLKLGIKSSLPHVKSTLALSVLLWLVMGQPAELVYSQKNGAGITIHADLEPRFKDYLHALIQSEDISEDDVLTLVKENQLFKSQIEALIVAFELIWRLARVEFVDTNKPASAERTGGERYPKKLLYSANIDILGALISSNSTVYNRILLSWLGLDIAVDDVAEQNLLSTLNILSENAVYKLSDGNKDILFNQNCVYKKLVDTNEIVDINGDGEAKGSLRILKSLLSDSLNPYLRYSNEGVSIVEGKSIEAYQQRVETMLKLNATKVITPNDTIDSSENVINNEKEFRKWLGSIVIPEGDSNRGQPYSSQTIETYVSDIKYHKVIIDGEEKTLFETNDIEIINHLLSTEDLSSQRRTAIRKYRQFIAERKGKVNYYTGYESDFQRNRIVFGAPGTGKSFKLKIDAAKLLGGDEVDYERVTFHPDYSYANFVGTYKPVPSKDEAGFDAISYEYVPGPFMRVYVEALKNGKTDEVKPFLLLIEEINRANVAAVFGDVFQLLDRDDRNASEYPIQTSKDIREYLAQELGGEPDDYTQIRIPDNMFIWASMNSADQGVYPMDTAFKRRWDFTYIGIDDNEHDLIGKTVVVGSKEKQRVEWNSLRKSINNYLADHGVNEDKQLGPYFISKDIVIPKEGTEIDPSRFADVFKNKVIMYLFEDAGKRLKDLFEGSARNNRRYSEICKAFDEQGIGIFHHNIQNAIAVQDLTRNDHELDENGLVKDERNE